MGRIRRHDQRPLPARGRPDRGRGRDGRLADPTLPGEQMTRTASAHLDPALETLERVLDHALGALGAEEARHEDAELDRRAGR